MIRALRGIAGAFAYFSILPIGRRAAAAGEPPDVAAIEWLPAVGVAIGAIAGFGGYAAYAWLHAPWSFAVAWALTLGLTGAIHADGFLDSCDGLFVTATPQRRLEILTDPRHGTFAIVGMAIVAIFALAALAAIAPQRYPLVLAFAGAAARLPTLALARSFRYARSGGMTRTFEVPPSVASIVLNVMLVESLAWFVAPRALAIAPAALVYAYAAAAWAGRRLGGGLTGDVYGGLIVTIEVLALLAISITPTR